MKDKIKCLSREEFVAKAAESQLEGNEIIRKGAILQGVEEIGSNDENAENSETRQLRFIVSTATPDRDNDTINVQGWDLADYLKNPVVLWAHESWSPPVAKAKTLEIKETALLSDAEFMHRDISEFSYMVYQMYKNGFMNAVSAGFQPLEWGMAEDRDGGLDFKRQTLFEYSAVPVPANPEALQVARSKGINTIPLREWAEKTLDEDGFQSLLVPKTLIETIRKTADPKGTFALKVGLKEDNKDTLEVLEGDHISNTPIKRVISYDDAHTGGSSIASKDTVWDITKEVSAASDEDLRTMCLLYGGESTTSESRLAHHEKESKHVVWKSLVLAMKSLIEGRHGLSDDDKRVAYDHLKKHYEEFNEVAPEFRYCEAEVLRTLPEVFYFDVESGQIQKTASYQDKPASVEGDSKGEEISLDELKTMVGNSISRQLNQLTGKLD